MQQHAEEDFCFLDDVVFEDEDVFDVDELLALLKAELDAEESLAEQPCSAEESLAEKPCSCPPSDSVPHCCGWTSSMTTEVRAKHKAWSAKKKRRVKYGRKFVYGKKAAVARSRPRANKKFAKRTTGEDEYDLRLDSPPGFLDNLLDAKLDAEESLAEQPCSRADLWSPTPLWVR